MNSNCYTRPKKPFITVKPVINIKLPIHSEYVAPKLIAVDKGTECHTTPDQVASRMVGYLEIDQYHTVLDPHAGTGQLVQALLNNGIMGGYINTLELHCSLCEFMRDRFKDTFVNINHGDVFDSEYDNFINEYDRIICNPPFKQIVKHIDRVYSFLKVGGVAICLVPITYKKINHEILEKLDQNIFANCKVYTKLIRIEKNE